MTREKPSSKPVHARGWVGKRNKLGSVRGEADVCDESRGSGKAFSPCMRTMSCRKRAKVFSSLCKAKASQGGRQARAKKQGMCVWLMVDVVRCCLCFCAVREGFLVCEERKRKPGKRLRKSKRRAWYILLACVGLSLG